MKRLSEVRSIVADSVSSLPLNRLRSLLRISYFVAGVEFSTMRVVNASFLSAVVNVISEE